MSAEPKKSYEKIRDRGGALVTNGFLFFLVVDLIVVGAFNYLDENQYKYTEYMTYGDYAIPKFSWHILMGQGLTLLAGALAWGIGQAGVMHSAANSNPNKPKEVINNKLTPQPAR